LADFTGGLAFHEAIAFWNEVEHHRHFQRIMVHQQDSARLTALENALPAMAKLRVQTYRGRNTGAVYTALPREGLACLTLGDETMRTAMQSRLGLTPVPPEGYNLCPCGADLRNAPSHGLHCVQIRRREVLHRHDQLTMVIAKIVRMVGGRAEFEPKPFRFHDGRLPDLRICLGDRDMLIDVTVRDSLAPSVIGRNSGRVAGGLLDEAEKAKCAKYAEQCKLEGTEFHPMAFEASGKVGNAAREVFKAIAHHADMMDNGKSYRYVMSLLNHACAVTIAQGNHLAMAACRRNIADWVRAGRPSAHKAVAPGVA
jgi:hypothetical protein